MSALHSCVTRKTDIQIWVGFITKLKRISTFMSDEEPTETDHVSELFGKSRSSSFPYLNPQSVQTSIPSPEAPETRSFARLDMSEVFEQ